MQYKWERRERKLRRKKRNKEFFIFSHWEMYCNPDFIRKYSKIIKDIAGE